MPSDTIDLVSKYQWFRAPLPDDVGADRLNSVPNAPVRGDVFGHSQNSAQRHGIPGLTGARANSLSPFPRSNK